MQQLSSTGISKNLNRNKFNKIILSLIIFISLTNLMISAKANTDNNKASQENLNTENTNKPQIKNILVIIFPGGKSHHFVMKKLFDYVLNNPNNSNFVYNFHLLVHNYDTDIWKNASRDYKIISFGNQEKFDVIFNRALSKVKEDPIFGYDVFSKAMVYILEEFANSNVLTELKKTKYDMIISDIPNSIFKFLKEYLNIKNGMFLCPPALPNLFYGLFEMNPVTLPALGSPFTDKLTFWQRLQNFVFVYGFETMGLKFMREQLDVLRDAGHKIDYNNFFVYDAFIMLQYPTGFGFNISRPPNMAFLNYITPTKAAPLKGSESDIDEFLNTYKKNVYVAQGTIFKNIEFDRILKIFEELSDVGFVLSIKKEVSDLYKFPKNVHLKTWVNQNNLLGDKRIFAFVTHGGINSVLEAIYHKKPVIALGVALDQVNTAGMVKTRETGISFFSQSEITAEKLISAIKDVIADNNKYLKNTIKYSEILKVNRPATEEFSYWLEYGLNHGYQHLIVKAYEHFESFQFYNYDIIAMFLILIFVLIWLMVNLFKRIFLLICKKRIQEKTKED